MDEQTLWNFGPFRLDVRNEQLWCEQEVLHLTNKALAVLRYLVEHHGQLVTKDDLFAAVWPEVIVSDGALVVCIRELRQTLGDERRTPRFIETIHGRGYRFVATVSAQAVSSFEFRVSSLEEGARSQNSEDDKQEEATQKTNGREAEREIETEEVETEREKPRKGRVVSQLALGLALLVGIIIAVQYLSLPTPNPQPPIPNFSPALPLPDKPSIVVLPFTNISGDPTQEYFSDGITEEITATLSRVSSLFVIARTSAFTYKGKAARVQDISRAMGVRYVLEGSVQNADGQVRITVQLIDAVTGGHLWSSRYERELRDIFVLQDEIGRKIVTALKVNLMPDEQERFRRAPTTNLEAYDYLLRGYEPYWQDTKEANTQARQLFEHAIALDPQYAGAYAWLSFTYVRDWNWQWNRDRQILDLAFDAAQKALVLDEALPLAHVALAVVYQKRNQQEQAIASAERAVALNPNNSSAYMAVAELMGIAGRPEEGIAMAKTAMRLNPRYPPWYLLSLGMAYHQAWRNDEAIATLKRFLVYYPNALNAHIGLTCSYNDAGREEEARAEAAEVMRLSPNFQTEVWRQNQFWKETKEMERHLNNLRKAGLK